MSGLVVPTCDLAHFRQRPEDDMLEVSLSYNQNPVSPNPQLAPPPQTRPHPSLSHEASWEEASIPTLPGVLGSPSCVRHTAESIWPEALVVAAWEQAWPCLEWV